MMENIAKLYAEKLRKHPQFNNNWQNTKFIYSKRLNEEDSVRICDFIPDEEEIFKGEFSIVINRYEKIINDKKAKRLAEYAINWKFEHEEDLIFFELL